MATTRKRLGVVAALGCAGALAVAQPAFAAQAVNGSAYGAKVSLAGASVLSPTPTVTLPPSGARQQTTLASVTVPGGVLTAHALNVETNGDPSKGTSHSQASVSNVTAFSNLVPTLLTAKTITASCDATPSGETGSATIVDGVVSGVPVLTTNPSPNTTISVPGVATVVLNQQVHNSDGSLTVNAVHITVLPTVNGGADVVLASATCGPNAAAPPIPTFPGEGLPLAGGIVVLAGMAGAGWWLHRRRISFSPAES